MAKEAKQAKQAETASPDGKKPQTEEGAERRQKVAAIYVEAGEERLLQALDSPRQLQEVLVDFWFNHFNVFQGKGLDARAGRELRARGDPPQRARALPHDAGRDGQASGDAVLPGQLAVGRAGLPAAAPRRRRRRGQGQRPQRELRPRGDGAAHAGRGRRLHAAGRHRARAHPHRLDDAAAAAARGAASHGRAWTRAPAARATRSSASTPRATTTAPRPGWATACAPDGQMEGEFALDVLARHPATARHIAFKLARRFVADEPSPALVDRLAQALPRHRRRPARRDAGAGRQPRVPRPAAGQVQDAVPVRAVVGARHRHRHHQRASR